MKLIILKLVNLFTKKFVRFLRSIQTTLSFFKTNENCHESTWVIKNSKYSEFFSMCGNSLNKLNLFQNLETISPDTLKKN